MSPNLTGGGGGVDFSLSVSPGSQAVTAGQGINFLVTVNPSSNSAPAVQLSVSGAPAGALAQFVNGPLTSGGTVSLSIITSPTTAPGTSQLTITGSDPSGTQKTTVMLTVNSPPPPPDFNLTATPGSQGTLVGGSAIYLIAVTSNGTPTVNLSMANVPAGITAEFDSNSITGSGSAHLTVSTTASTALNSYNLTVVGSDPSGTQSIQITLVVAPTDFSLSSDLGEVAVTAGATLTGTLTVTPVVGTPGTVNLSLLSPAPTGITVTFSSSTVAEGNGSVTMTIAVGASVAPNSYQLNIQGSDSTGAQTVPIVLAVGTGNPAAGFTISVAPPDQTVNAGDTAVYTLNVLTNGSPVPSVNVDVSGTPDGAFQVTQSSAGTFTINVFTNSGDNSSTSDITITVTGPNGSQSVTVTLEVNQNNGC